MTAQLDASITNVVRFPVEKRVQPTLNSLRELVPEREIISKILQKYGLALPTVCFRQYADVETAEYIQRNIEVRQGTIRDQMLSGLLDPTVFEAVAAIHEWQHLVRSAEASQRHLSELKADEGRGFGALAQQHEVLERQAANLLLKAYVLCEKAEGVARAVNLAREGQIWTSSYLPSST